MWGVPRSAQLSSKYSHKLRALLSPCQPFHLIVFQHLSGHTALSFLSGTSQGHKLTLFYLEAGVNSGDDAANLAVRCDEAWNIWRWLWTFWNLEFLIKFRWFLHYAWLGCEIINSSGSWRSRGMKRLSHSGSLSCILATKAQMQLTTECVWTLFTSPWCTHMCTHTHTFCWLESFQDQPSTAHELLLQDEAFVSSVCE